MGTPAVQDLTIYWNGTALCRTSGNIQTVLTRHPRFTPYVLKPDGQYVGASDVIGEQGDPATDAMVATLYLTHKATALASALAVERTLMDEMRAFQAILNPMAGAGTLRIDRSTAAAAAVSSEVLKARPVSVPRYGLDVVTNDGLVEPTRGNLDTAWELWCPLPYFYDRVATTAAVTADTAPGVVVAANAGPIATGVRFQVTGATLAPTQVNINNTTNGYSLIWRRTTGTFTPGDYVDWFYTDPREEVHSANTTLGPAVTPTGTDYCELSPGNNTITATRSGGTGTVSLTISWKHRYLSL